MLFDLMVGHLKFKDLRFLKFKNLFEKLRDKQNPDTLFFTCADSRIVPSLITHAKPGDLFVHRNVGNIVPPSPIASGEAATIEYSLSALEVKHIIICGHSGCGAMKGLLTPDLATKLPQVAAWLQHSQPVLEAMQQEGSDTELDFTKKLATVTQKNILLQIEHLKTYPLVGEKLAQGHLSIHGWLYDIESGQVSVYEQTTNAFISFAQAMEQTIETRKNKLITTVAMQYVMQKTNPATAEEYEGLRELLNNIQDNIRSIWQCIEVEVQEKLWNELGAMFESKSDSHFTDLLASGSEVKLADLTALNSEIYKSKGYQEYTAQPRPNTFFDNDAAVSALSECISGKRP